jgi:hypothetical protein
MKRLGLCIVCALSLLFSCQLFTPALSWTDVGGTGGPAFSDNWGNCGNPYPVCSYALDLQGSLHIVGMIKDSTPLPSSQVAFTLPEGFRPASLQSAVVKSMDADFLGSGIATVYINVNGNVQVFPNSSNSDDIIDFGHIVVKMD